jgi:hypothetical protein
MFASISFTASYFDLDFIIDDIDVFPDNAFCLSSYKSFTFYFAFYFKISYDSFIFITYIKDSTSLCSFFKPIYIKSNWFLF